MRISSTIFSIVFLIALMAACDGTPPDNYGLEKGDFFFLQSHGEKAHVFWVAYETRDKIFAFECVNCSKSEFPKYMIGENDLIPIRNNELDYREMAARFAQQ